MPEGAEAVAIATIVSVAGRQGRRVEDLGKTEPN